jgi:hypothetical protein
MGEEQGRKALAWSTEEYVKRCGSMFKVQLCKPAEKIDVYVFQ